MTDRATQYAIDVLDGKYVVGRAIKLAAERHLRWIRESEKPDSPYRWVPARSEKALDFFRLVNHFEGPLAGTPVELAAWQCFAIGPIYGWRYMDPESGQWSRRIRKAFTEVAKKNGKSLTAGGIGLLEAFFNGEPGAQVYSAATKRDQAKLVWGASKVMVDKSPALRGHVQTRALSLYHDTCLYRPLGKDTKSEDGINPSCVIVDELHRHEDRSLVDLLTQSFGARSNPLLYIITTAGLVGESVWAEDHDYCIKVLEGVLDDDRLWPVIYNLDDPLKEGGDDPFDPNVWAKANPNLGISVRVSDMQERAKEAKEKPGALADFLRLRLNVRTKSENKWLLPEQWNQTNIAHEPMGSRLAYGGLDLGSVLDLSSLIMLTTRSDGQGVDCFAKFWVPEDGIEDRERRDQVPYRRWVADGWITVTPGGVTDYDYIRKDMAELLKELDLWEIGYDQHNATQLAGQLEQDGFVMVKVQQSAAELSSAVTEVERWMSQGRLACGDNPVLRWMADNVVMIEDAQGRRKPDKMKARERIDGISALLDAVKRYVANVGTETDWGAA